MKNRRTFFIQFLKVCQKITSIFAATRCRPSLNAVHLHCRVPMPFRRPPIDSPSASPSYHSIRSQRLESLQYGSRESCSEASRAAEPRRSETVLSEDTGRPEDLQDALGKGVLRLEERAA